MKFILEFNSYKKPTYKVGDVVLVEYWYLDEPSCPPLLHKEFPYTPVKIVEKLSNVSFKISHNVSNSKIKNAPDEIIKTTDIIDFYR
jgi:hypothetical protein